MKKKELNPKQIAAIELLAKGYEQKTVAEMIKCHESTLCHWLKDSNFRQLRDEKVREQFKDIAAIAQSVSVEIMNDKTQKAADRLKAAFDILDRAGYKPVEKSEVTVENVDISVDYGDDDG